MPNHEPTFDIHHERPSNAPGTEPPLADIEHLQRTAHRFRGRIETGISVAETGQQPLSRSSARLVAHVLGRAYGRHSALAEYGRTGEGDPHTLRAEYVDLQCTPELPAEAHDWIHRLDSYFCQQEATPTRTNEEHINDYPPGEEEHYETF